MLATEAGKALYGFHISRQLFLQLLVGFFQTSHLVLELLAALSFDRQLCVAYPKILIQLVPFFFEPVDSGRETDACFSGRYYTATGDIISSNRIIFCCQDSFKCLIDPTT